MQVLWEFFFLDFSFFFFCIIFTSFQLSIVNGVFDCNKKMSFLSFQNLYSSFHGSFLFKNKISSKATFKMALNHLNFLLLLLHLSLILMLDHVVSRTMLPVTSLPCCGEERDEF